MNTSRGVYVWTLRLPSGGYKAIVWGHHDDNNMSWRGDNFRKATIPGQPHRGFATNEEARAFGLQAFATKLEMLSFASYTNGSALPECGVEDDPMISRIDYPWDAAN